MTVRSIQPGELIEADRGDVVVCIPVYGAHDEFVACFESVLANTPDDIAVLVCDDASPDPRSRDYVFRRGLTLSDRPRLLYTRNRQNLGFPANMNAAIASAAPADVIVLNSDCRVSYGWLDGLREAAYVDGITATATALTNHGTVVSVPARDTPCPTLPEAWSFDDAAAAVRSHSLRLRPRIPTAVGHCFFIRRSALELVGDFDLRYSPGYGEEVDFSQRCLQAGLSHVVADDVFVFHRGGRSFAAEAKAIAIQGDHERMLADRYPSYHKAVRATQLDRIGRLPRALGAARRALLGMKVVIDARSLDGRTVQRQPLALLSALASVGTVDLVAVVPMGFDGQAMGMVTGLDGMDGITLLPLAVGEKPPVTSVADVVHRATPSPNEEELRLVAPLGERLIVSHEHLLDYRDSSAFSSFETWDRYRRVTRMTLLAADRVIFPSGRARDDALAEELVEPGRAVVVAQPEAERWDPQTEIEPRPPRGAEKLAAGSELILLMVSDRRHSNRVFALRMLEQMQQRYEWQGQLALCASRTAEARFSPEEEDFLAQNLRLSSAVLALPELDDPELRWLLRQASLVVCPAVHGGYEPIAFKAAELDVPCLFSPGSALSELLPDEPAMTAWDSAQTGERAAMLMRDPGYRAANVSALRDARERLSWRSATGRLLEVYNEACESPPNSRKELWQALGRISEPVHGGSDDARRLIGPDGALPEDLYRPLLALAHHPRLGKPFFRTLAEAYEISRRLGDKRRRLRAERHGMARDNRLYDPPP